MRFSHTSLGGLMLAMATPAFANPSTIDDPAATAAIDAMTPVAVPDPAAPEAPAPVSPVLQDEPTAPPPAFTFTGGVTLVSDYRFRGLTQTNGDPAVQATININHSSGLYIGTWVSQIDGQLDASTPALTGYGGAEMDLYGGFTKTLSNGFGFDIGLLYYYYPTRTSGFKTDFFEPYASINYTIGPVNAKLGANYAWGGQDGLDFTSGKDDDIYVYGELSLAVPQTPVTLKGHLGRTSGSLGLVNLDSSDEYMDWSITAEAAISGLKVGVSYVDTDISNARDFYEKGVGHSYVGKVDKFANFYGRGSTVLAYIGYSF